MPHLRHGCAPGLGTSHNSIAEGEEVSMTSCQLQLLMLLCLVLYTKSLALGFTCYFLLPFCAAYFLLLWILRSCQKTIVLSFYPLNKLDFLILTKYFRLSSVDFLWLILHVSSFNFFKVFFKYIMCLVYLESNFTYATHYSFIKF